MIDNKKMLQDDEGLMKRRQRAVVLAWILVGFVCLVFSVTIVKLGGNIMNLPS